MQEPKRRIESILSAVFALGGIAFLLHAEFSETRAVLHWVLFELGCALSCFALAVQPSALLENVERQGFKIRLPRGRGVAALLNLASTGCVVLAGLAWLISTLSS
jgi:protein-S-isoprenylcysteine O-methyltransferase Ste14